MSMGPVEASWFYPCLCGYWRSAAFFADTFNTQLMNELVTFSNHKIIDHFTVSCLVAWPLNESEAGGDLVLIETSLLFSC